MAYQVNGVKVQIRFRKGLFVCPSCGTEDVIDWSVTGGNTYENNCSNCGQWTNNFINYDGCMSVPYDEYGEIDEKSVDEKKNQQFNDWNYQRKNPPAYVEPSVADYNNMITDRLNEVEQMSIKMAEIATAEEMVELSNKLAAQKNSVDAKVVSITAVEAVEKTIKGE